MSRIDRVLFLIFRDRSRRERMFAAYIHHKNLYSKGNGEISFWVGMANIDTFLLLSIFVKTQFPWIPLWLYVVLFPILIFLRTGAAWFIGWWWDRNDLFARESDWTNKRNPTIDALGRKLDNGTDNKILRYDHNGNSEWVSLDSLDKKVLQPGLKQ